MSDKGFESGRFEVAGPLTVNGSVIAPPQLEEAAAFLERVADLLGDTELDTMWEVLAWLRGQAHALRATGELAEDEVEPRPASDAAIAAAARAMYDENRSPYLNGDQHDAGYTDVVAAGYTNLALAGFAAAERVRHAHV